MSLSKSKLLDIKTSALAATPGPEHIYTHFRDSNNHKANEFFHHNCYPQHVIELIDRLQHAEARRDQLESERNRAQDIVAEYQKIIAGECLRLKPGDVLVVRFDPRYVPTERAEYVALREQLRSILPAGVSAFFLLADIKLEVLSGEQLAEAGLMRLPSISKSEE